MSNPSRFFDYAQRMAMVAAMALAAGCGGDDDTAVCVDNATRDPRLPACGTAQPPSASATASSVQLLVSTQQLAADGTSTAAITIIALDANRVGVAGRAVTLSVTDPAGAAYASGFGGAATSGERVTDANGQFTATLYAGGNKTNRTIALAATIDSASAVNAVDVVGTSLAITGTSTLGLNAVTSLGIALTDASGAPIGGATVTIASANGNTVAPASVTTDANGKATTTVTGRKSGADTISVEAMGARATLALNVSSNGFAFTTPLPGATPQVLVNASLPVVVRWTNDAGPVAGMTVNFQATRGTLSASQVTTSGSGEATVAISSASPGPATITATSPNAGGVSATANVTFVISNTPTSLDLQADRTTISVNAPNATTNAATIYAIARDDANNLVPGAVVNFHIDQDTTGGALTAGAVVTDSNGVARTQYVPTSIASPTNGVVIRATLVDKSGNAIASRTLQLTVGGQKLFVRIGTDNLLERVDANYVKKYVAFVTDAAGNPVPGAVVQFLLRPRQDVAFDPAHLGDAGYVTRFLQRDVNPPAGVPQSYDYAFAKGARRWNGAIWETVVSARCFNEDVNANGILDRGEDYSGDGKLEPGNGFSVSGDVETNSAGYSTARITYLKDRAGWTTVTVLATARVAGTEASDSATFTLPILLEDVSTELASPPGQVSPYGTSENCGEPK